MNLVAYKQPATYPHNCNYNLRSFTYGLSDTGKQRLQAAITVERTGSDY